MHRFRLVTQQDGEEHVSGYVFGESEIEEQLDLEAMLHTAGGWEVERRDDAITCRKAGTVRVVAVRSTSPMNDPVP